MNCHEEAKPFKCEECPLAFMMPFILRDHSETHKTDVKLPCSQCHKTFPSEILFKYHEKIHTEEHKLKLKEPNKYYCPIDNCFNKLGFRSAKELEILN